MLELINNYKQSFIGYIKLVNSLVAMLDAGEFKDEKFINSWFELWAPLEEQNAIYGNETKIDDIINELERFENFIKGRLKI
jgi:hypothetical protein